MGYFSILRAQRKSGPAPTIKKTPMSEKQKQLAEQGICTNCAEHTAAKNSFICTDCQAQDTLEDIQKEIEDLRRQLLGNS